MKYSKKIMAMLLAMLYIFPILASCASDVHTEDTNDDISDNVNYDTATIEPDTINRENASIKLPELNFGSEVINVLYTGDPIYAQEIGRAHV